MIINFNYLKFKNLLSFGANETVIQFSKGINLISGKNGSGKSAILDALSFCLFGKPYRDIKIKELINRKNKKNTEIECEFTINTKDTIKIKRTLNPDSLEIIKNGTEADLLSSKRLNQEELNKIIGIDYNLFRHVISLAVNYNKPFLSLSALQKREIIEQIFNITIFGLMLKEAKKINSENNIKHNLNVNSINNFVENLKTLKKNGQELVKANSEFEKNKANDLETIEQRINNYKNNINIINKNLENITENINSIDIQSILNSINETKTKLTEITRVANIKEFSIKNNIAIIKNLETDINCPRCLSVLTEEHKEKETAKLNKEINLLKNELDTLIAEIKNIKSSLESLEISKQDYEKLLINKQNITEKLEILQNELINLQNNKQTIINRKIDIDIEKIKKDFVKKNNEYKLLVKNDKNLTDIIFNYETVFKILSETGIKAFFFKKLIPILNHKINEYLKLFEIPIVLNFDEFMNEKITNFENIKNNISYYSYSEGEKKRIDMAILLSFINITKAISNWNCNLLLIDELLDGAIDENGLDKLVTSLKNMTFDSNLSVYIISHRLQQDYNSKFNRCIQIEKSNGFSKINNI